MLENLSRKQILLLFGGLLVIILISGLINSLKNGREAESTTPTNPAVETVAESDQVNLQSMEYIETIEPITTFWEGTRDVSLATTPVQITQYGDELAVLTDGPVMDFQLFMEHVYETACNTYQTDAEMIIDCLQRAGKSGSLTKGVSLDEIYQSIQPVPVREALNGDIVFFYEDGKIARAGFYIGRNEMKYLDGAKCTTGLVSSLGFSFAFGRVCELKMPYESLPESTKLAYGFWKPALIDLTDAVAACFDYRVDELEIVCGDFLTVYGGNMYTPQIRIVEIDNTKWKDTCQIAIVGTQASMPIVVTYKSDTGLFETMGHTSYR